MDENQLAMMFPESYGQEQSRDEELTIINIEE